LHEVIQELLLKNLKESGGSGTETIKQELRKKERKERKREKR